MTSGDPIAPVAASPIPGFYADPALIVAGDRYWLAPTTDGRQDWAADEFRLFSSFDLQDWTAHGTVLRLGVDVSWATTNGWAPMYVQHDGRAFLYYSAEDNIGVAVSDGPAGPFVDLGRPLIARGEFSGRAIDPSVFRDDDGQHYLLWGNGEAHIVPLNPDLTSFDPASVRTWTPTDFREAPWMHRNGGTYYLSWSENDTRDTDYRVRYAVGSSPYGPWNDRGVLIEADVDRGVYSTGHHSISRGPHPDDWIIAYHRWAIPGGDGFHREVMFDRLHHLPDGGIERVMPSREALRLPLTAPDGPSAAVL